MGWISFSGLELLLAQVTVAEDFRFPGGIRVFTGLTMLVHMFFAELFVGFAIAAPVLQAWGRGPEARGWTASRTRWCGSTS